ncbi:aldolase/citrate lyase family protein [Roseicyclus sp. F158]|uniref:Aldolase/citrate lyase family protein n=1 Tax=Tropicimonas omnivorans TaxID=3075590 RepID=A0ABU3DE75_9RHOB|nr:aldolase/citrate lyase family protein [Roseicyclus sp. F158]MDT0682021.1 aldolase/citrate lyase family protein [Roseicyclus sp. F158]
MTLREQLEQGRALRGPFCGLPSPDTVEVICAAGPDFVCFDGEHSAIRGAALTNMLRAAACHRIPAIVRVPDGLPHIVAEILDAGAAGILVPRVSDVAAARAAVSASRFPPVGERGVGPGRVAGYGYNIGPMMSAAPPLVGVQIETIEAVEAAADILAVEGIDFALIGPGDLGVSLAASGVDEDLDTLIDRIFEVAKKLDMPCGIFAPDREKALAEASRAQLVIQGSDAMLLHAAARAAFG